MALIDSRTEPRSVSPRREGERARQSAFAIDHEFEMLLGQANGSLRDLELELTRAVARPATPLVVLCYAPRSGSTYLGQLLARSGRINYISNFTARFWEAPVFAASLEKRLGLRGFAYPSDITSRYGVTPSPHEPHEFGFFWNKWLRFAAPTHRIDPEAMTEEATGGLVRELSGLMTLYDQPFFLKSDLVGLNVAFFDALFEDVRFVVLHREPVYVAQSIYRARCDLYGDPAAYWSTRPSSFTALQDLPAALQIAGQIRGIYDDVRQGIAEVEARSLDVSYERLCEDPQGQIERICSFAGIEHSIPRLKASPRSCNGRKLSRNVFDQLERAVARFF